MLLIGIPRVKEKEAARNRRGEDPPWTSSSLSAYPGQRQRGRPWREADGGQWLRPYAPQGAKRTKSSKS